MDSPGKSNHNVTQPSSTRTKSSTESLPMTTKSSSSTVVTENSTTCPSCTGLITIDLIELILGKLGIFGIKDITNFFSSVFKATFLSLMRSLTSSEIISLRPDAPHPNMINETKRIGLEIKIYQTI
jgi:hypothetical protein